MKKLMIKKETITKLNDDLMKKFVGGLAAIGTSSSSDDSCCEQSCNSQANTGSCEDDSCNCVKKDNLNFG
jgi:hypothetical protein